MYMLHIYTCQARSRSAVDLRFDPPIACRSLEPMEPMEPMRLERVDAGVDGSTLSLNHYARSVQPVVAVAHVSMIRPCPRPGGP